MLLSTKLMPPQTSDFVIARPRLYDRLDSATRGKLTLVTAPAGYGKSTLVANWLTQRDEDSAKTAWLALDEYDDEPARFLRYFIAALQGLVPDAGESVQASLQSNVTPLPQSIEEMITVLINDLAQSSSPMLLVVDDFHLISDRQIVDGMRFWIEHAPASIHTVLISRDASLLPIARWRVRSQCTELPAGELCFTTEEAAAFVREMLRLDLTDEHILQLTRRTEGWIAGIQLAALSLQSSDNPDDLLERFTGSDRHVMDYLIEEVLQKQSDELRNFLLETSILSRLSADLCDSVTGQGNSYDLLEQMEKGNLFLAPLDNQREWYRYHPLFAESLQARLLTSRWRDVADLHARAYAWFVEQEFYEEAIEHALAAKLYPQAAESIGHLGQSMIWGESRPMAFLRWCRELPDDLLYAQPTLAISAGWAQLLTGQYGDLAGLTQGVRDAWSVNDCAGAVNRHWQNELAVLEAEVAVNLGQVSHVMQILDQIDADAEPLNAATEAIYHQLYGYAYRLDGNIPAARDALQKAVSLTAQGSQRSLWIYANADLAETYVMAGELANADGAYKSILRSFPTDQYPTYAPMAFIYMSLARVQYLANHLAEATESIQRGLSLSRRNSWITQFGTMIQAEIQHLQGNWPVVEEMLAGMDRLPRQHLGPRQIAIIDAFRARQFLLHDQPDQATQWARLYRQSADLIPRYQLHRMDVTYGRYLGATNPTAAIDTLEPLRVTATDAGWRESQIEIEVLLALAFEVTEDEQGALTVLNRALALAEAEQILAPFLIEGAAIAPLLRRSAGSTAQRSFVGQLQAAFLPAVAAPAQPLAEPLTKRELDVVRMMADGLSNPEIADRLILATGTVAKHSNNIYGKLGVRNRTEAAQRARTLGLI